MKKIIEEALLFPYLINKIILNVKKALLFPYSINKIILSLKKAKIGRNFQTNGFIYSKIPRRCKVLIGNNVIINSRSKANPIGCGVKTFLKMTNQGELIIGDNVGMSNVAIACANKVSIGNNVLLGGGVKIYDTDFHPVNHLDRLNHPSDLTRIGCKPIIICDNVFIGAGAFILKGSEIGEGSVVGAGSVVCGKIPEYEIWAGNPAKFIRKVMK